MPAGQPVRPARRARLLLRYDGPVDRIGFGYAFYLPSGALQAFIPSLVLCRRRRREFCRVLGVDGEQYRTECRGSALAFASCIGRFVAAGATFLVGIGIQRYGSMGVPVALTAMPFVLGLMLLPLAVETRGQPLPA